MCLDQIKGIKLDVTPNTPLSHSKLGPLGILQSDFLVTSICSVFNRLQSVRNASLGVHSLQIRTTAVYIVI